MQHLMSGSELVHEERIVRPETTMTPTWKDENVDFRLSGTDSSLQISSASFSAFCFCSSVKASTLRRLVPLCCGSRPPPRVMNWSMYIDRQTFALKQPPNRLLRCSRLGALSFPLPMTLAKSLEMAAVGVFERFDDGFVACGNRQSNEESTANCAV